MFVFVVDKNRQPLDPCHPARARKLLSLGRAVVIRRYPFTILLINKAVEESITHEHRVKIDPGSKTTGIAVVQEKTGRVTFAAHLCHRGQSIRDSLLSRRALRRSRRNRKTRYRQPRFNNRSRCSRWLPPSLESRVANTITWVQRISQLCPLTAISLELVKFDTQALQSPEISGAEYQQGTLFGYEVREYLLTKWGRNCVYCGATDTPLEVEHIHPRSKGGSDRVSNLTLACHSCNQKKGDKPVEKFLAKNPDLLKKILSQAKAPISDAAAVNATRWVLYRRVQSLGCEVEVGTGGRTKFNRCGKGIEKSHWADAACVGASTPENLVVTGVKPLLIKATGWGTRQRCRSDKYGFPARHAPKAKYFQGFQTGDIVQAKIPSGKYAGDYVGRIAIRFRPSFMLLLPNKRFDVHPKYLKIIHKADGYEYSK